MKQRVAFAVLLAALVAGCGGSSQQTSSPARPAASETPPTRGFETPGAAAKPVSYRRGRAQALRTAPPEDTYVHAHLDMGLLDHCLTNGQQVDWATNSGGACYGDFKDGTYPFTGGKGAWSTWSKQNGRIDITIGTMHLGDDPAASQRRIGCSIADRSDWDCVTGAGSHLVFTVASGDYILLRGMCKPGDDECTPHQYGGRPSLKG